MKYKIIKELKNRGYEVDEKTIQKNGINQDAIIIGKPGDNFRPIVYIAACLELADTCEEIVDKILSMIEKSNKECMPSFKKIDFMDKDMFLNNVQIFVQRAGTDNVVKKPTEYDGIEQFLALQFENGRAKVTDAYLKQIGLDADDVWEKALKNTISVGTFKSMSEMLGLSDFFFPAPIYVVSNHSCSFGASQILNEELLKSVAEKLDTNEIYIIPCSVHEILVIPFNDSPDIETLTQIVHDANGSEVDALEQLSDTAYYKKF